MTREEAIKEIKSWDFLEGKEIEAIQTLIPELRESKDEGIRKALIWHLKAGEDFVSNGVTKAECLAYLEKQKERGPLTKEEEYILHRIIDYLEDETCPSEWISLLHDIYCLPYEKQKEQKLAEHKAFEEWAEDYWSHNKVNNPYSYNKGDEIQFDHKGFVSFCEAYCYPQNLVLHDTFGYEEGRQTGRNEGVKLVLNNPEKYGLQKEQKPVDDKAFEEWIDGWFQEHKEKAYPQITMDEKEFKNFCRGIRNMHQQKSAEWSEEDEKMFEQVVDVVYDYCPDPVAKYKLKDWLMQRLKSLKPQPHWKPSEEQMNALYDILHPADTVNRPVLESLYEQLKKL